MDLDREFWVARSKKFKMRKNRKDFPFYVKNAYFSTETNNNFSKKGHVK